MKLKNLLLCATLAAALAIGAAPNSAVASSYTSVPLAVSGSLLYITNAGVLVMGAAQTKRLSFNTQSLIKLLNASPNASNTVFGLTGQTQIPAGSFFLWNPEDESLTITNKNGFSFPMMGTDVKGASYDYGDLDISAFELVGNYTLNAKTQAGTETDTTGITFHFFDGRVNNDENELYLYGTATMHWTYGPVENGFQNATLSVTMAGNGNDGSFINGAPAVVTSFTASGAGTASEPTGSTGSGDIPFFWTW